MVHAFMLMLSANRKTPNKIIVTFFASYHNSIKYTKNLSQVYAMNLLYMYEPRHVFFGYI